MPIGLRIGGHWDGMRGGTFADRREAGRVLADALAAYRGAPGLLVLGLPRGGVPVAWEVAAALRAPLDVFVVRKLGAPRWEELAVGALASGGLVVLNDDVVRSLRISDEQLQRVIDKEAAELSRREDAYRGGRPPIEPAGKTVILVDDGIADRGKHAGGDPGHPRGRPGENRGRGPGGAAVGVPPAR